MSYTLGGRPLVIDTTTPVSVDHTTPTVNGNTCSVHAPASGPIHAGVLCCHQAGGDASFIDSSFGLILVTYLASRGFPCIAVSNGDKWGSDSERTDMDANWAYLVSEFGVDESEVALFGLSMGNTSAMSWASVNLASVSSIASVVPVSSTQDFYDNRGGAASIDAAYGGAPGWAAAAATHDPTQIAAAGGLDGLAVKFWYGDQDTACPPETVEALAAEMTPSPTLVEMVGGHFSVVAATDYYAVASFIIGQYAPTARARMLVT